MSQPRQRLAHLMPSTAIYAGDIPVPIYPTIPAPSSERPKDINDLHRATSGGLSLAMLEDLSEPVPLAAQSRPTDPPPRARSQVLKELQAILAAIQSGEPKDALIERLMSVTLTGEKGEAGLLTRIGAVRGWRGIVAEMKRPAASAQGPILRVVEEGEGEPERAKPDGLPAGWSDPVGWICAQDGIYQVKETKEGSVPVRVTQDPLWIGRRWKDVDGGGHTVDVQWPGGSAIVGREVAMDSRGIIGLAAKGAPVSSASARSATAWLEVSERENRAAVPVAAAISRVGWTETGGVRMLQTSEGPHLLRAEDGHAQTARALAPAGSAQRWLEAAAEINRSPVGAIMLAASVASVMLEATGAPPFVVDLNGMSSRGKTTALRWAASAWADPADGAAYILPWSATLAAIEGRAGFLRHLPVLIDDSKKVAPADRSKIAGVVYQWGSGQGRARGRVDGVREVVTWRSILISTGEAPLTRLAGEHAGMRLRVLPLDAQPFEEGAPAIDLIESLTEWGHAGPMVAAWTVHHWSGLRERWERRREEVQAQLGGGPSGGRLAQYIASVSLAVEALVAVGVPMPAMAEMRALLLRAGQTALASADLAGEAWDRIGGWLVSQQGRIKAANGRTEAPPSGWIGRIASSGVVAVMPAELEAEMQRQGYDAAELIPQWAARGYLVASERGQKVPTWWEGISVRMYRLKIEGWRVWEPEAPPPPADSGERW